MQTNHDGGLEQFSTQQLDQMFQAAIEKEDADPSEVKKILDVLKEREKEMPVTAGDREKLAWQRYKAREKEGADKPVKKHGWALRAAAIVVVFCAMTVAVVHNVEAKGFWGRIVRWTDSVAEFFSPNYASGGQQEYEFQTDHPGLQQVYDTVTRLGVTEPMVPMWLPEGYESVSFKEMESDNKTTVTAFFQNGDKVINYNLAVCSDGVLNQFQKDETVIKVVELSGVEHYVVSNNDKWVAVWMKENVECSISTDCQEDELYRILRSIYDKEEAQ